MTIKIHPMATLVELNEAYNVHSILSTSWLNYSVKEMTLGLDYDYYEDCIVREFEDLAGGVYLETSDSEYLQFKLVAGSDSDGAFNDAVCLLFRLTQDLGLELHNVY